MPSTPSDPATATATRTGPLAGVRILDLSSVVMGPFATRHLADLGADVVKVEHPSGDVMRWIGPSRNRGMGPIYLEANHGKRSITADLTSAEDRRHVLELAAECDVFFTNIRPQALARNGLAYDDVVAVNPQVVYLAATGYSSDGPLAGRAVYDDLMQAASGISALFGEVDGTPRYVPLNVCDRVVGMYAALATVAALHYRQATGKGQFVEVPMFEAMAQFVLGDHLGGEAFDPPAGPMRYPRLLSRSRGPYATADGHLSVVVYSDRHWRAFSALVGEPDLMDTDARFADQQSRTVHAEAVGEYLGRHMATATSAEWTARLQASDIPVGPVNSVADLLQDPHLEKVGHFAWIDHPTEGRVRTCTSPMRFSRSPLSLPNSAPPLSARGHEITWSPRP